MCMGSRGPEEAVNALRVGARVMHGLYPVEGARKYLAVCIDELREIF